MSEPRWLSLVRDVPDFPKPGIVFKDITPVLADPAAFREVVDGICEHFRDEAPDVVLGIEARGFILAAPVALALGAGFVPARKRGKLPWETHTVLYELEYGTEQLELHRDALGAGHRVLIVDDVLATGGTAAAAVSMVEQCGADIVGLGFLIELGFLSGRAKLGGRKVFALTSY